MSFAVSSVSRIARSYLYAVPFAVPTGSKAAAAAVAKPFFKAFFSAILMRPVQSLRHRFEEING